MYTREVNAFTAKLLMNEEAQKWKLNGVEWLHAQVLYSVRVRLTVQQISHLYTSSVQNLKSS